MTRQGGQVLAFLALAMPIVLLPVVAYAVDAAVIGMRAAGLQAATAAAAETAAQKLDIATLRSGGGLALDPAAARRVAVEVVDGYEAGASIDSLSVSGVQVTVETSETVEPPLALFTKSVTLHARATARLVAGYSSARSLLALPASTF